jgi:hypothetical protein
MKQSVRETPTFLTWLISTGTFLEIIVYPLRYEILSRLVGARAIYSFLAAFLSQSLEGK